MDNTTKLYDEVDKLREENDSFDTLVSNIDSKFDEFITNFQSKLALTGWKTLVILKVPYTKLKHQDKNLLERYLSCKYSVFGGHFGIKRFFFFKKYIIINHI